jgi:hypothetical protein
LIDAEHRHTASESAFSATGALHNYPAVGCGLRAGVEWGFGLQARPRAGAGGRVPGPASCEANGFARVTPTQAGILRAYSALKAGAGGLMRVTQRFLGPTHDDEAVMNGLLDQLPRAHARKSGF